MATFLDYNLKLIAIFALISGSKPVVRVPLGVREKSQEVRQIFVIIELSHFLTNKQLDIS